MSQQKCSKCGANQRSTPLFADGLCIFHTQQGKRRVTKHLPPGQDYPTLEISNEREDRKIKQDFIQTFRIYHSREINKAIKFKRKNPYHIRCQGYIFPAFTRAEWHELWNLDFSDSDEMQYGIGAGRTMPIGINFEDCTFIGDVLFDHTTFTQGFQMTGCTVAGTAIFNETSFFHDVSFQNTVFNQTAFFIGTAFAEKTDNKSNDSSPSLLGANFQHVAFLGNPSAWPPSKYQDAGEFKQGFRLVTRTSGRYIGAANFDAAKFQHDQTSFYNARFAGNVSFSAAEFGIENAEGKVEFTKSIFYGDLEIDRAIFNHYVKFSGAVFNKLVAITDSVISNLLNFEYTCFYGVARFASFRTPNWEQELTFRGARIFEHFAIQGISSNIIQLNFTDVDVFNKGQILFKDFNLSFTSLWQSNFWFNGSRIHFNKVQWPLKGRFKILPDDFLEKPKAKHFYGVFKDTKNDAKMLEELEHQYRQIRMAYEARGCYTEAGDFFAGEMNARSKRLQQTALRPIRRGWFGDVVLYALHSLYGLFGKWGESPARVVFWLAFFMLGLLPLWLLASGGFTVHGKPQEFDLLCWSSCEFDYSYYQNAVNYTLQSMTLRFPETFSTRGFWASLPAVFARVLGPALITILGISLRRRFRRSSGE